MSIQELARETRAQQALQHEEKWRSDAVSYRTTTFIEGLRGLNIEVLPEDLQWRESLEEYGPIPFIVRDDLQFEYTHELSLSATCPKCGRLANYGLAGNPLVRLADRLEQLPECVHCFNRKAHRSEIWWLRRDLILRFFGLRSVNDR